MRHYATPVFMIGIPWVSPTAKFIGRYAAKTVEKMILFGSGLLINSFAAERPDEFSRGWNPRYLTRLKKMDERDIDLDKLYGFDLQHRGKTKD